MKYFRDDEIKALVANPNIYIRGLKYYRQGAVEELYYDTITKQINGVVTGEEYYQVTIQFTGGGDMSSFHCSCPAFAKYTGACKHVVATMKQCNEKFNKQQHQQDILKDLSTSHFTSDEETNLIEAFRREQSLEFGTEKRKCHVEVYMNAEKSQEFFKGRKLNMSLYIKMGEHQLYVLKDYNTFFHAWNNHLPMDFGKHFTYYPSVHQFDEEYVKLFQVIKEIYEIYAYNKQTGYNRYLPKVISGKTAHLNDLYLKRVFAALGDKSFILEGMTSKGKIKNTNHESLPVQLKIEELGRRLEVHFLHVEDYYLLTEDAEYVYFREDIYHLDSSKSRYFKLLYEEAYKRRGIINFSGGHRDAFISEVLTALKGWVEIQMASSIKDKIIEAGLVSKVYIDQGEEGLLIKSTFVYDQFEFNAFTDEKNLKSDELIVQRDAAGESKVKVLLTPYLEYADGRGQLCIDEEEVMYGFIFEVLPKLSTLCQIYYSESFKKIPLVHQPTIKNDIRFAERLNFLEYTFSVEGIDPTEFYELYKSVKEKKRYYRAKNGSIFNIDNDDFYGFMAFMDNLDLKKADLNNGSVTVPQYRAMYINDYLKENKALNFHRSKTFRDLVENVHEPEDMEYKVPDTLNSILRDYQVTGYKWLKTLSAYNFGGILADDMGLGKTLQTIAFILSEYESMKKPSIVVAPTSLVYNWKDEIMKFAPELNVTVVSGDKVTRKELIKDIGDEHMVLTSYALVRNDIDLYKIIEFGYCIIDEAQYIKNPNALLSKAVKDIQAKGYFALTGTPIENSLKELWSIFDFLMPGYLFSYGNFAERYERPIVKDQNKRAIRLLSRQINPFILRRMKKDVLKELPPKIEDVKTCELTMEQKKLYVSYLEKVKEEIYGEISERGYERSKIKILALLTRLRQICCHPELFMEDYEGDSGKLELLQELVEEAIAGKHRILIFSQFTSMLKIIEKMLTKMGIEYFYLDGSVKSNERIERVKAFNNGEREIFLISLKAGGTGLNLTSADMVIHYDPWWNPAVEEQATDRAYRIGQENKVQVIRLLTRGTIEEKIFKLKDKKKHLVESVISPGDSLISKMNKEEIFALFED
ncbi:SNF2 helicase associated domain-containing protein [Vallitalea okinawensis]|uniref:SNF2 helicase associated domain-containing protein n=1 Tax=Vallitalea okinawensis TaxID=2078660 RepID=UPI000CFB0435|nr:SNF2 helicase associated domain-containing protein [Vallitalea okinawensis]